MIRNSRVVTSTFLVQNYHTRYQRRHHPPPQISNGVMLESVLSSTISIAVTIKYPTWLFDGKTHKGRLSSESQSVFFIGIIMWYIAVVTITILLNSSDSQFGENARIKFYILHTISRLEFCRKHKKRKRPLPSSELASHKIFIQTIDH